MCVVVTVFQMIGLRARSAKRFIEFDEIEWDSELVVVTMFSILFYFFQLYGMNVYVESV